MEVGYLPDMFGHVAQMPQLLRRVGFEHAVVWRGVPAAVDRTAFWWGAPDGSTVRAEYLLGGYGNGADLPDDPGAARREGRPLRRRRAGRSMATGSILAMYGTDHAVPSPSLARPWPRPTTANPGIVVRIETLSDYIRASTRSSRIRPPDPAVAPVWTGELRSGARANMLLNVTSARIDIKAAAGRAERALERYAEPIAALPAAPGRNACSSSPGGGSSTTPPTTRSAAARRTWWSPRS